jgi:hypothetical protein
MDDLTQFENRFQVRVRAFALTGVQPVDSAAVARAVIRNRTRGWLPDLGRLRLPVDRRALVAVAVVVLVAAVAAVLLPRLQQGLVVGTSPSPLPSPAPTASPTTTPLRLGIAYGDGESIWRVNRDGTLPLLVAATDTSDPCGEVGEDRGITSPNARYIAYRTSWSDECQGWLYVFDSAGRPVVRVAGAGWDIAWSPDSTALATWIGSESSIGVYDLGGDLQATLDAARYIGSGDHDAWWSPDGAASILTTSGSQDWELPIDGSEPRQIELPDPRWYGGWHPASRTDVDYSPDRTRAVVISRERVVGGDELILMDADGSERSVLSAAEPGRYRRAVKWSPAGNQIAFSEVEDEPFLAYPSYLESANVLNVLNIETGAVVTAASVEPPGYLSLIGFSPDGAWLMYSVEGDVQGETSSIWIAATDGSGAQMVVERASVGGWVVLP